MEAIILSLVILLILNLVTLKLLDIACEKAKDLKHDVEYNEQRLKEIIKECKKHDIELDTFYF